MRDSFAATLTSLAADDERIVLLSGDIGNRMFDDFKTVAPKRFVNCGIAEANMMSVASGLAMGGFRPVVYTIAPFTTARCYEQIRIGVAYHEAPVLIVGTGAGLSYGPLGATHHSLDDIALFSAIGPDIDIYTPADPSQTASQLKYFFAHNRPAYMRLGKKGEPTITDTKDGVNPLDPQFVRDGEETVIITIGPLADEMIKAADLIQAAETSRNPAVVALGSIEPFPSSFLRQLVSKKYRQWLVVEEHSASGGLADRVMRLMHRDTFFSEINTIFLNSGSSVLFEIGSQKYLRQTCGIDKNSVMKWVLES